MDCDIDDILKLKAKFLAGKGALEEDESQYLFNALEGKLACLVKKDMFAGPVDPELVNTWRDIFHLAFDSQMAHELAGAIDPEVFFRLGEYLAGHPGTPGMPELIHGYLDIFRLSPFLNRIYGQSRWEELTAKLIRGSNFTVSRLFHQRVRVYKKKVLFKVLQGKGESYYSWQTTSEMVTLYARAVAALMLRETGGEGKIAFLMENSLTMALLDLACLTSGVVNIMIPANSVSQQIAFILNQTKAPLLLVSNEKQLSKIKPVKGELPHLRRVVLMEGSSAEDWVINFREFLSLEENDAAEAAVFLEKLGSGITTQSLATLMYTSGTTGEPKGIMFSQMNIVYKRFCRAMAIPGIGDGDRFLSYLPLFHTFGRWLEMMGSIFWGATYAFMENPGVDTMVANMGMIKPTVFISIPKKWLQLYEQVTGRVDIELAEPDVIRDALAAVTGGELKWGLSAAGYLPAEVFRFFQEYGVRLMSGFGMTEATGGITMTPPGGYRPDSLGKALPGIQIKVAQDGELLIRGDYVMMGYYDQEESETFMAGGWLPTGDIMRMDHDAFIEIIDRKKEIYKNIKGETIAPQRIENFFREFRFVRQVFLVGDHQPFNTLLIYPNGEAEDSLFSTMTEEEKTGYFSSIIVTVNKFLAPFERIVDFRIIPRPFTLEKGELTPKGTYKRRVIAEHFGETIDSMYTRNYDSVQLQGTEVRIPNWFIREKGCLSGDIIALQDGLSIPKLQARLKIIRSDKGENIFRIGDYYYEIKTGYIDLQALLAYPVYWMGNTGLYDFAGEYVLQGYRRDRPDESAAFYSTAAAGIDAEPLADRLTHYLEAGEQSLNGLHHAVVLLQSDETHAFLAVQYLQFILENETLAIYKLARRILARPGLTDSLSVRRELFKLAVKHSEKSREFRDLLESYLCRNRDLLDDAVIDAIVEASRNNRNLDAIDSVLKQEIDAYCSIEPESREEIEKTALPLLFNLTSSFGIKHPTGYKRIRQIIVRYLLLEKECGLTRLATQAWEKLLLGFRNWLGANQTVAVDVETGKEYNWNDVIVWEQDMDPKDRERIREAIAGTSLLREGIFLFSRGVLTRLNDILPRGVWISLLGRSQYKTIYRISIQTRFQGSFDIRLTLNKNLPDDKVEEEVNWLILAGSASPERRLVDDFGGYWKEFDLWTEEYVHGESVSRYLRRESRKNDGETTERLKRSWPFFTWNAARMYALFRKLTGYRLELAEPSPQNIVAPPHDYQTGTRLVSISQRRESTSELAFFGNFYKSFVLEIETRYPGIAKESIWNYVFSGVLDAEGEDGGVAILQRFLAQLNGTEDFENKTQVTAMLEKFLAYVNTYGFIPRQLFFAIKRFHRWFQLNREASLNAQAEMLYQLYETYNLQDLEQSHPGSRVRFYLETAFIGSAEALKNVLREMLIQQHRKPLSKDEVLERLSGIRSGFELSETESFFLTRLGYAHLKPTDSAQLMEMKSAGAATLNLVVQAVDYDGAPFMIRSPVSPGEISRLHQMFLEARLPVHFRPEHQFLVALSQRNYLIGGLFYHQTDEQTAHMEKIVVSDRYRRKGISEGLMNEFFNRLRSEHIRFVTTGFFRPEYFYRFGFKIEHKYSGLVKELT